MRALEKRCSGGCQFGAALLLLDVCLPVIWHNQGRQLLHQALCQWQKSKTELKQKSQSYCIEMFFNSTALFFFMISYFSLRGLEQLDPFIENHSGPTSGISGSRTSSTSWLFFDNFLCHLTAQMNQFLDTIKQQQGQHRCDRLKPQD